MVINFLGDSITEQYFASTYDKCYVALVGKLLNCKVNNYGISATRIAKQIIPSQDPAWDNYFALRVKDMDPNADLTFVMGGTNDFGHGDAPIGKLGDTEPTTFYGAMDNLCKELLKKYKKEQVVFILPLYRFNDDDPLGDHMRDKPTLPLQGYRDVMTEVLNKYDIEVLDIKDQVGKPKDTNNFEDGLHPNDAGHRKIAELLVNFISKRK